MANKNSNMMRIPRDVTVGDLVAWAEAIGCVVEFALIKRDAELRVHQSNGDGTSEAANDESTTEIVE